MSGTLTDPLGQPIEGVVSVVLSVYAEVTGGAPLFTELQIVTADARGRYSALLGVTTARGVPLELFMSAEARWLGVQPAGQAELPRALIISVPYALKAADAETLGGLPASAFQRVDDHGRRPDEEAAAAPAAPGGGGTEKAERWQATAPVGPGFIADAVSGPPLQVASSEVVPLLNVDMLDGLHASAFARLATPNIFAATQTVNADVVVSGALIGRVVAISSAGDAVNGQWTPATPGFGVVGRTASTNGGASGVYGVATAASGAGSVHGVYGETLGSVGAAVRGLSRQNGLGVEGLSEGTIGGVGVRGHAFSTAGPTVGVDGVVDSSSGTAIGGWARSAGGTTTGLRARVDSPAGVSGKFNGVGGDLVVGETSNTPVFRVAGDGSVFAASYRNLAGAIVGTGTVTEVSAGTGISGGSITTAGTLSLDTGFTDARYALFGHGHLVGDIAGAATLGANQFSASQAISGDLTATGLVEAQRGAFSTASGIRTLNVSHTGENGVAIQASAAANVGGGVGIQGSSSSPSGIGVLGQGGASTGPSVGVRGDTFSGTGTGVLGHVATSAAAGVGVRGVVASTDGTGAGVVGEAQSPLAVAGVFDNTAGGDILVGRRAGSPRFRVDGDGHLYAAGYRDLSGNPIPSGTGDITAVSPGAGLTGGGGIGDVTLALDTGYTNTLYAPVVHGHVVGQVAGAATLGANAFAGNQNVTGSLSVIGAADVDGGIAAFGGPTKPNAVGVRGETTSGTAEGVLGVAISVTGRGARGHATGTAGTGIKGEASATSGATTGVLGVVSSAGGIAGLFENTAGGDLLKGVSAGSQAFRVDGSGAVYAASYRDLAGNPIPAGTGDITAVTAGTGLTGGGGTGDLSLALDTSYTNTLYAPAVHGHAVTQVAGAATLGANAFTGAQQISHTLTVSGDGVGQSSLLATNSLTSGISVRGTAFGVGGRGVYGEGFDGVQGVSANATGRGVFGWATNSTGGGVGVNGQAGGSSGVGVSGQAYSTTGVTRGVLGTSSSADGIGVDGVASAAAGPAVGVRGRSSAAGAGVQAIATGTGAAGVFDHTAGGDLLVGRSGGGLTPVFRVDGTGRGFFNNGTQVGGADFAESFAVSGGRHEHEPGDVLIIDTTLRRTLEKSFSAYSTMVAGVHSTKPGVLASPHPAGDPRLAEEVPLAVVGIVPCKVTAENGPIRAGDLLVTSSTPGYAMKGTDRTRMLGAIVGKALEPLNEASGTILVLITLQ